MLYDPKWEQQTKADPYSFASLVSWLETMPPSQSYHAGRPSHCLLGQFVAAMGERDESLIIERSYDLGTTEPFKRVALGKRMERYEWTFGAALDRARAATR